MDGMPALEKVLLQRRQKSLLCAKRFESRAEPLDVVIRQLHP